MTAAEYRQPATFIFRHGSQNTCPTRAWRVTMTREEYSTRQYRYPCPTCGREREGREIQGRVSHKHKCGAKCRSSKGWQCECSCGGANHGAGFDIEPPPTREMSALEWDTEYMKQTAGAEWAE